MKPTIEALRPCIVDDRKGLFHGWYYYAEVLEPSIMVGGHMGGPIATTLGIVEFENGEIQLIRPTSIKFIGSRRLMQEYCFEEDILDEEKK